MYDGLGMELGDDIFLEPSDLDILLGGEVNDIDKSRGSDRRAAGIRLQCGALASFGVHDPLVDFLSPYDRAERYSIIYGSGLTSVAAAIGTYQIAVPAAHEPAVPPMSAPPIDAFSKKEEEKGVTGFSPAFVLESSPVPEHRQYTFPDGYGGTQSAGHGGSVAESVKADESDVAAQEDDNVTEDYPEEGDGEEEGEEEVSQVRGRGRSSRRLSKPKRYEPDWSDDFEGPSRALRGGRTQGHQGRQVVAGGGSGPVGGVKKAGRAGASGARGPAAAAAAQGDDRATQIKVCQCCGAKGANIRRSICTQWSHVLMAFLRRHFGAAGQMICNKCHSTCNNYNSRHPELYGWPETPEGHKAASLPDGIRLLANLNETREHVSRAQRGRVGVRARAPNRRGRYGHLKQLDDDAGG